jgi:thiol peroxidase
MSSQTVPEEHTGKLTARGAGLTLQGRQLNVGDAAPELHLTAGDFSVKTLDDLTEGGKHAVMLIAVPSLDTGVCSTESHTFNSRIAELGDDVKAYVVSMDLPFAQARWCGAEGDVKLGMLSDFRDHRFGKDYGLRIKENGLLARAIVLIGKDKTIRYVQLVPELTSEPDYDAAIKAAQEAAK